jgi:hypothetical protein
MVVASRGNALRSVNLAPVVNGVKYDGPEGFTQAA